ncbi:hypothetical protein DUD43_14540 [Alcaligenes faecalis]|nr:hypothetical protein DUD43_14540 [Alcaligenes faecalis]
MAGFERFFCALGSKFVGFEVWVEGGGQARGGLMGADEGRIAGGILRRPLLGVRAQGAQGGLLADAARRCPWQSVNRGAA